MSSRLVARFFVGVAILVGALVTLVIVLVLVGVLHLYRIPSSSMETTLHCARPALGCRGGTSDRVVALKYVFGSPSRGDLIALHTPPLAEVRCGAGGIFIKRVVGLPGERVAERSGFVYVDGKRLSEPYVRPDDRDVRTFGPVVVPPRSYWVLGDNRSSSCDSRAWGMLPRKDVIGKVVATYWPPSRITIR